MAWPNRVNWMPPLRTVKNVPPRIAKGRKVYIHAKSFSGPEMNDTMLLKIPIAIPSLLVPSQTAKREPREMARLPE